MASMGEGSGGAIGLMDTSVDHMGEDLWEDGVDELDSNTAQHTPPPQPEGSYVVSKLNG